MRALESEPTPLRKTIRAERKGTARDVAPTLPAAWLTTKAAAEYASCSTKTIHRAAEAGLLSGVKTSPTPRSPWRFRSSDVDAWLEAGRVANGPTNRLRVVR